jgi:hypothetical protein
MINLLLNSVNKIMNQTCLIIISKKKIVMLLYFQGKILYQTIIILITVITIKKFIKIRMI